MITEYDLPHTGGAWFSNCRRYRYSLRRCFAGTVAVCSQREPFVCFGVVQWNTHTILVKSGQVQLSRAIILFGRFSEPLYRLSIIAANTFTTPIHIPDYIFCDWMPLFSRSQEPLCRFKIVLLDTFAHAQQVTQIELCSH